MFFSPVIIAIGIIVLYGLCTYLFAAMISKAVEIVEDRYGGNEKIAWLFVAVLAPFLTFLFFFWVDFAGVENEEYPFYIFFYFVALAFIAARGYRMDAIKRTGFRAEKMDEKSRYSYKSTRVSDSHSLFYS